MIVVRLAALALAVAATASPGFAQEKNPISDARARAIHDCSTAAAKYQDTPWGAAWQTQIYRACMAQHGQREE